MVAWIKHTVIGQGRQSLRHQATLQILAVLVLEKGGGRGKVARMGSTPTRVWHICTQQQASSHVPAGNHPHSHNTAHPPRLALVT